MSIRSAAALTLAAGLCLGVIGTSLSPASAQNVPTAGTTPAQPGLPVYDIEFPGGTLGEYLDVVTRSTRANIVAPDEVRRLSMPRVHLEDVTADAAVQMLSAMFSDRVGERLIIQTVRGSSGRGMGVDTPMGADQVAEAAARSLVQVYVITLFPNRAPDAPVTVNDVFSIGDYLRPANEEPVDQQVSSIFEMVESAMRLTTSGDDSRDPELAYHDETQMLVFRGSPEQRAMIEAVLERYGNSWRPASSQAQGLRREIGNLRLEATTTEIEARSAMQRLEAARRDLLEAEKLVEAGAVSSRELADVRGRVADLEAQFQIMQARAEHARVQAAECEQQLAALSQRQAPSAAIYDFHGLGARGDRVGAAFKALLEAADLPGTRIEADGTGSVTLHAAPPVHEALRYLLMQIRSRTRTDVVPTGR